MSTHLTGLNHFSGFLHHFVLAKLANSSVRVKYESITPLMAWFGRQAYSFPRHISRGGIYIELVIPNLILSGKNMHRTGSRPINSNVL